jgi:hypothetical protein
VRVVNESKRGKNKMGLLGWILAIVGIIIVILVIIKLTTKGGESSNSNSLLEKARGGMGKLADCCKKLLR